MKCLTVTTQKGGVGKTFVSVQSAYRLLLGKPGLRVCLIDFDHQGDASRAIQRGAAVLDAEGIDVHVPRITSAQVLSDPGASAELPPDATGLTLLRADALPLRSFESEPELKLTRAKNLHSFLRRHRHLWDAVVIDTNPSPDIRVLAALMCSTHVVAVTQPRFEALRGLRAFRTDPQMGYDVVRAKYNPHLQLVGIVVNAAHARYEKEAVYLVRAVAAYPDDFFRLADGDLVSVIPESKTIQDAQATGMPLKILARTDRNAQRVIKACEPSFGAIARAMTPAVRSGDEPAEQLPQRGSTHQASGVDAEASA